MPNLMIAPVYSGILLLKRAKSSKSLQDNDEAVCAWITITYIHLVLKGIIAIQIKSNNAGNSWFFKTSRFDFIPEIVDPELIPNDLVWLEEKIIESIEHRQNHDAITTLERQIFTLISMILRSKKEMKNPWSAVEDRIIENTNSRYWKIAANKRFFNLLSEKTISIDDRNRDLMESEYSKFEVYFKELMNVTEFNAFYHELLKLINQTLEQYETFD